MHGMNRTRANNAVGQRCRLSLCVSQLLRFCSVFEMSRSVTNIPALYIYKVAAMFAKKSRLLCSVHAHTAADLMLPRNLFKSQHTNA